MIQDVHHEPRPTAATSPQRALLFGGIQWHAGKQSLTIDRGRRPLVLGLLLLHAPRVVTLERFASALWPGIAPAEARQALHVQIHRLRRLLPTDDSSGERIRTRSDGYALSLDGLSVDVHDFRCHGENVLRQVSRSRPAGAVESARRALAQWTGDPFGAGCRQVASWPEIMRLVSLRRQVMETLFDAELAEGRHAELVMDLRRATTEHPDWEPFHGQLMQALAGCGRHLEAVRAFRAYRLWKISRFGLEPGTDLYDLYHNALRPSPSTSLPPPPESAPNAPAHTAVHVSESAQQALLRAADFAEQMGGYRQAGECLTALLSTKPRDDPSQARLLLRLAHCRLRADGAGAADAEQALRSFVARQDVTGIVEANLVLSWIAWCGSEAERARQALARAQDALASQPTRAWPISVLASATGLLAVTGRHREADALAGAALDCTTGTSPNWEVARLFSNRGIARFGLGDPTAAIDYKTAVDIHEQAAGWAATSLLANLLDALPVDGDLNGYTHVLQRLWSAARWRGSLLDLRFLEGNEAWHAFWRGDLAASRTRVRRWLDEDDGHFLTDRCLWLDARLRMMAGDLDGAEPVIEQLLGRCSRRTDGLAAPVAPLAAATLRARRGGPARTIRPLVEQAIGLMGQGFLPPETGAELPLAMIAGAVSVDALDEVPNSPWCTAARHLARGDRLLAIQRYRGIGSRPDVTIATTGWSQGLGKVVR